MLMENRVLLLMWAVVLALFALLLTRCPSDTSPSRGGSVLPAETYAAQEVQRVEGIVRDHAARMEPLRQAVAESDADARTLAIHAELTSWAP